MTTNGQSPFGTIYLEIEVGHEYEEEMALCFDLLQICDKLVVASELSTGVRMEIDLAKKLLNGDGEPMEVEYLEY